MRDEQPLLSPFDAEAVRRRLEGTLASKLVGITQHRAAAGRRRTKAVVLIVALMAVNAVNVMSNMPSTPKALIAAVILLLVVMAVLVASGKPWSKRMPSLRQAQDYSPDNGNGLSDAEMDAWLAGLPAITPVGKERLATILAMNDADLGVISSWIDREVERLEIAHEERRLGLRSETVDQRVANVRTLREERGVAQIGASS